MIQFFHVTKRYPNGQIGLEDVTFRIPRSQFVFLTGASGAGKSTLLKLIYRGLLPTVGQILVNGRNLASIPRRKVPYLRRTIGTVFQEFRLIGRRTVLENVSYLPRILGASPRQRRQVAEEALDRVHLKDRIDDLPEHLSAGEQQRVAIARALVSRPEILIADEPTGNLDPDLSREIFGLFREVNEAGTTVLLATHDRHLVEEAGGRVLHLAGGRLASGGDEVGGGGAPGVDS